MQQLLLWAVAPAGRAVARSSLNTRHLSTPCAGCGAKPGQWQPTPRFQWILGSIGLCAECASIREVVTDHLRDERPPDPDYCRFPRGSDEKIALMAKRAQRGQAIFQICDNNLDPAPFKRILGAPDYQHDPGETGVERCGERWRARPFWRGRKWSLGVFDKEHYAIGRAKAFWRIHAGDDRPPPILWLPCCDQDGAIAIEREHLVEWRGDYPGVNARRIARRYRKELRCLRQKPGMDDVWKELVGRLEAASGPTLFSHLLAGESEPADECQECLECLSEPLRV